MLENAKTNKDGILDVGKAFQTLYEQFVGPTFKCRYCGVSWKSMLLTLLESVQISQTMPRKGEACTGPSRPPWSERGL
jgi:hypothetical protein